MATDVVPKENRTLPHNAEAERTVLGAVLVDEKIKVWKGEPFERAMVNFYLGLVYYLRHDYGNARGAFENALFKLRDYNNADDKNTDKYTQTESNFVLADLMLAKSWQQLGREDKADAEFEKGRVAHVSRFLPERRLGGAHPGHPQPVHAAASSTS